MASCNGIKKHLKPAERALLKNAILKKYKDRIMPKTHGELIVAINKKVKYKNPNYSPLTKFEKYILRRKLNTLEMVSYSLVEQTLGPKWIIEGYDIESILR